MTGNRNFLTGARGLVAWFSIFIGLSAAKCVATVFKTIGSQASNASIGEFLGRGGNGHRGWARPRAHAVRDSDAPTGRLWEFGMTYPVSKLYWRRIKQQPRRCGAVRHEEQCAGHSCHHPFLRHFTLHCGSLWIQKKLHLLKWK